MSDGTPSIRFFQVMSSILDLEVTALDPQISRDTLEEWDSIKHMYIILALEEEFGIEFSDEEIEKLAALSELMESVASKTGSLLSWDEARAAA